MATTNLTGARSLPESAAVLDEAAPAAADTSWPRRILVASGGSRSAEHALAAARALAADSGARVEIVSTFVPRIPLPMSGDSRGRHQCEAGDRGEAAEVLRAVRAQRARHRPAGVLWPIRFQVGDRAREIARAARETGADVVVLGIGQESLEQRQQGHCTSIRVAEQLDVPVYAAAVGADTLPARGVIALPGGEPHDRTIRTMLRCMGAGGALWIAVGRRRDPVDLSRAAATASMGEARLAARAVRRLVHATRRDLRVRTTMLDDREVGGVLRLADEVGAQLIAVPLRGPAGPVRELLPNVAGPLLLGARCSVLVVPDEPTQGGV